jgi:Icc-related predicted phosphoesterase
VRVAFTSDLHADHHPEVVELIASAATTAGVEVLIVAGDVSPSLEKLREVLGRLREAAPRVAFVPGNHDLWSTGGGDPDARARYEDVLPGICARAGVDYLPSGPIVLDGGTIVGQTGWYDLSLKDPAHDATISRAAYEEGRFGALAWSDKRYIRWPGVDGDAGLTSLMASRLARDLARAPHDRPALVATHMLPFAELVARRPLPWGFVNAFLGSTQLGAVIGAAAQAGLPVARAICGHTHFRRTAEVSLGGRAVPVETSPIGYPREVRMQGRALDEHVAERVRIVEI